MAFGLDDSDFEDLLESSSSEEDAPALSSVVLQPKTVPTLRALTASANREPLQSPGLDASCCVPPNRWMTIFRERILTPPRSRD